jgi:hypothetical protein
MVTVAKLALNRGGEAKGSSSKSKENSSELSAKMSSVILTLKHSLRVALLKVRNTSGVSGFRGV